MNDLSEIQSLTHIEHHLKMLEHVIEVKGVAV